MLDKTMNAGLLALRKQIIRGDGAGLEHVEALLTMRAVPMPRVLPPKRADVARRGHMRRFVLASLADGPLTLGELAALVAAWRPQVPPELGYYRTAQALYKMQGVGLVRCTKRRWRVAERPPG